MSIAREKTEKLHSVIREMESVLVAFSGGVDSSLLAKVAHLELGERALAVTGDSPSLPRSELIACRELATEIGIPLLVVPTHELEDPRYAANPDNRCYFCKSELFQVAQQTARKHGLQWVVEGTHAEELEGHRPGHQATLENNIRSPLVEAGFSKQDIRAYAEKLGLPVASKPALACLASRFPTGVTVTAERLREIETAEAILRQHLDVPDRQIRARYHGEALRLVVGKPDFEWAVSDAARQAATVVLEGTAFRFVVLDLVPYGERGQGVRFPSGEQNVDPEKLATSHGQVTGWYEKEGLLVLAINGEDINKISDAAFRQGLFNYFATSGHQHITIELQTTEESRGK